MSIKMTTSYLTTLLFVAQVFLSLQGYGQWVRSAESRSLTRTTGLSHDGAGNVYSAGLMTCNTIFETDTLFNNSCGEDTLTAPVLNQLDIFISSHDETGGLNWTTKFTGEPENLLFINALETDNNDDSYLAGGFISDLDINTTVLVNDDTTSDGFLVKISPAGATQWGLKIGSTDSSLVTVNDVTVNNSSVFVSGQFRGRIDVGAENDSVRYISAFLASFNKTNGNPEWLRTLPPVETTSESIGRAVSVDNGEVFMLVNFRDSVAITANDTLVPPGMLTGASAVLRYQLDGTYVSHKVLNTQGLTDLHFAAPNLYVTGAYTDDFAVGVDTVINDLGTRAFLLQLDVNLTPQWVLPVISNNTTMLRGNSISVNNMGNVFLAGSYSGGFIQAGPLNAPGNNTQNGFLLKTDPSGSPTWLQSVGSTGPDEALIISALDESRVYTGGYFEDYIRFAGDEIFNDGGISKGFTARIDVCPEISVEIDGQPTNYTCAGDVFTFEATQDLTYTYQWFKDGAPLPGETNFNFVADTLGSYRVEITSPTCVKFTPSRELVLNVLPDTAIVANEGLLACVGDSLTLTGPSSPYDFQWLESGNPTDIGDTLQVFTIRADGDYSLRMTTDSLCTLTSFERQVRFLNYPDSSTNLAGGREEICDGENVLLQAEIDPTYTYQWLNGIDTIATATNSSFAATREGVYRAILQNVAGCVSVTFPDTVVIRSAPLIDLNDESIDPILCEGESVLISTPRVSSQMYQWQRNGIDIPMATTNALTVDQEGSYRVYVTNGRCDDFSGTVILTGVALPLSQVVGVSAFEFCEGEQSVLEANTGTGFTYQWRRDGVLLNGETRDTLIVAAGGRYTVEVFNSDGCSQLSNPELIQVRLAPPAAVTVDETVICDGESVELLGNAGTGLDYQWFRDGVRITGATARAYRAAITGDYALEVTNTNQCSALSSSQTIEVIPIPNSTISSDLPDICQGDSLELRASMNPTYNYNWLFNGNLVEGEEDNNFFATQVGNYQSVVYVGDCRDTSVVLPLVVRANPKPDLVRDDDFLSTSLFGTIQWFVDSTPLAESNVQNIQVKEDGNYQVQVVNAEGCTAISDPLPMCLPIPALSRSNDVLTVNEPGQQYEWYFKGNLIGGATRQALTAQQSGEYSVIMTFEDGCAMESFPVTVCIPYPFITQDEETGVLFANPPVAQAYQWYNDSIPLADEDLNVFIPGTPGLYRVEITDFDDCTAISEGFVVPEITGLLDESYGINIYPNPARDKLHIRLPPGQQAKALVYDLNGNRVEQASVVGRADMNIQHLVPGTYMFQLLLKNETLTVKIQKE